MGVSLKSVMNDQLLYYPLKDLLAQFDLGMAYICASLVFGWLAYRDWCDRQTTVFEEDSNDPGRWEMAREYMTPGEELTRLVLSNGGVLQVTTHKSKAQQEVVPLGMPNAAKQEWRVLRFQPDWALEDRYIQSVAKVCISSEQQGNLPLALQRPDCLPLAYMKTMAAITLTTLTALGASITCSGGQPKKRLKMLMIGLGGGPLATFFSKCLPCCDVDVVELEPAVLQAASDAMGFVQSPKLRVFIEDGAAFALRKAEGAASESGSEREGVYDAVLVDVADAAGNVPETFWNPDGDFCRALSAGLLSTKGSLLAVNFPPEPMKTGLAPVMSAYRKSLPECFRDGASFAVREPDMSLLGEVDPDSGNHIVVQTCGGLANLSKSELKDALTNAAEKVQSDGGYPFSVSQWALHGFHVARKETGLAGALPVPVTTGRPTPVGVPLEEYVSPGHISGQLD